MSTFSTSRGTRGQHVRPKWQSRPYQPSAARREAIYGRVQPMQQPRRSLDALCKAGMAVMALVMVLLTMKYGWQW